jgi:Fis family transcriptional regulator, factor for inversion stimulation protein
MKNQFDGLVECLLGGGVALPDAIEILERSMIAGALARHEGNQSAASKQLGIHRNTLQRKVVEYDLGAKSARSRRKPAGRAGRPRKRKTDVA